MTAKINRMRFFKLAIDEQELKQIRNLSKDPNSTHERLFIAQDFWSHNKIANV